MCVECQLKGWAFSDWRKTGKLELENNTLVSVRLLTNIVRATVQPGTPIPTAFLTFMAPLRKDSILLEYFLGRAQKLVASFLFKFTTWHFSFAVIDIRSHIVVRQFREVSPCACACVLFYFVLFAQEYFPRLLMPCSCVRRALPLML